MLFKRDKGLLAILLVAFIPFITSNAQMLQPVVGTYKGKSAQGMAIWGDDAYLFNDGGHCRVLDLKSGLVKREFDLASSGSNTHVNAVCFGCESLTGKQPVLYVSESKSPSRCFVECLNDSSSLLVQTISLKQNGKPVFVPSWIVDNKRKCIYSVVRMSAPKGEKRSNKVRISRFPLPKLSDGPDVVLTEKDLLDSFVVEYASGIQGGKVKGNYFYLVAGLQESARNKPNSKREIEVVDLEKRKLVRHIDLTYVTTNEPEDIDFYKGKALLYCGQNGGIYVIKN